MADTNSGADAGRFEVRVTSDSHFGWVRTRLSLERTMMSWLRTAVALIGFGFGLWESFEWRDETVTRSSTIMTTTPNAEMSELHCGIPATGR
jgi:inner membrane protein YidH